MAGDGEDVDGDDASDERQLFEQRYEETIAYVASEMGVVRVEVARDRVGGFGLVERCSANSIAADAGTVVVGTDEDVRVHTGGSDSFRSLGFGAAAAVGIASGTIYAASPDGRTGRLSGFRESDSSWEQPGDVDGPRRFDGDVLAADSGVFRLGTGIDQVGDLADVTDVARVHGSEERILAGTTDGLHERTDGWESVLERPVDRVLADRDDAWVLTSTGELLRRDGRSWTELDTPGSSPVVDIARGGSLYAVTGDGNLHVAADPDMTSDGHGGWRSQHIGVRGVTGLATSIADNDDDHRQSQSKRH
jgi:hypothetical protein